MWKFYERVSVCTRSNNSVHHPLNSNSKCKHNYPREHLPQKTISSKKSNHFLTSPRLILNFSSFRYAQKLIWDFWENFIMQVHNRSHLKKRHKKLKNVKFSAYKQINQLKHHLTFTFFETQEVFLRLDMKLLLHKRDIIPRKKTYFWVNDECLLKLYVNICENTRWGSRVRWKVH